MKVISGNHLKEIAATVKLQSYCMSQNPPLIWRESRTLDDGFDGEIELTKRDKYNNIVPTGMVAKVVLKATSRTLNGLPNISIRTKDLDYYNKADFRTLLFVHDSNSDYLYFTSLVGVKYDLSYTVKTIKIKETEKILLSDGRVYDEFNILIDKTNVDDNQYLLDEVAFDKSIENELFQCAAGKPDWKKYEAICIRALDFLFQNSFRNYHRVTQSRSFNGLDIKDLVVPNRSNNPFWNEVRIDYQARNVIFEFKNYQDPIGKDELIQVSNYLKKKSYGRFGIVICRKGLSDSGEKEQKELLRDDDKMILVLNDEDVIDLIRYRINGKEPETILERMKTGLELSL